MMKAFPHKGIDHLGNDMNFSGMDLRDYFAAKFMQSFMSSFHEDITWDGHEYAEYAYQLADAMMEVRNAKTKKD